MELVPEDPLAHRALESLLHAEASVRRSLARELSAQDLSPSAFGVLVVLAVAGGELEQGALRRRLRMSKAGVTELLDTLAARGLVRRARLPHDRRRAAVALTPEGGAVVERQFPAHSGRVRDVFAALDEQEKRSLAALCRKLAA